MRGRGPHHEATASASRFLLRGKALECRVRPDVFEFRFALGHFVAHETFHSEAREKVSLAQTYR